MCRILFLLSAVAVLACSSDDVISPPSASSSTSSGSGGAGGEGRGGGGGSTSPVSLADPCLGEGCELERVFTTVAARCGELGEPGDTGYFAYSERVGYYDGSGPLWEQAVHCNVEQPGSDFTQAACQAVCDALEIETDAAFSAEAGTCVCLRQLDILGAALGTQVLDMACGDRGDIRIVWNSLDDGFYLISLDCFGASLLATCEEVQAVLTPPLGVTLEATTSPDQCGFKPPT